MSKQWCHDHKISTSDNWKRGEWWSDESTFTQFPPSGRVDIWKTFKEAYNPDAWFQHRGSSTMVWAAISWYSTAFACPTFHGRITAREYVDGLGNQVHPMIQTLFPNNDAVFQVVNAPIHTAGTVQSWLKSMKVNFNIFPNQHSHQIGTSLNHSGQFWRLEWGTDVHLQHL
jgi:hypothetical protein